MTSIGNYGNYANRGVATQSNSSVGTGSAAGAGSAVGTGSAAGAGSTNTRRTVMYKAAPKESGSTGNELFTAKSTDTYRGTTYEVGTMFGKTAYRYGNFTSTDLNDIRSAIDDELNNASGIGAGSGAGRTSGAGGTSGVGRTSGSGTGRIWDNPKIKSLCENYIASLGSAIPSKNEAIDLSVAPDPYIGDVMIGDDWYTIEAHSHRESKVSYEKGKKVIKYSWSITFTVTNTDTLASYKMAISK